jgi:predicted pyridoxine 5'-phosphate oxidase superfamily flavin-nucleotide-binding protein
MGHKFADIAFTDSVKQIQTLEGSRNAYSKMEAGEDFNHVLGPKELAFISVRNSFYMATVSETGWPYIQHRGGPAGFIKILDSKTLGFADFRGNRQYVSVGNAQKNDRVSLFFMDYANRRRLKALGRISIVDTDDSAMMDRLAVSSDYRAKIERGIILKIEAFDWNCPQHITPRFTMDEVSELGGEAI